jgi:DNA (cytosine-5)-methyltransferase 1
MHTIWVIENVKPYYGFLIEPSVMLMRHPLWSNFDIPVKEFKKDHLRTAQIPDLQEKYDIDLSPYKLSEKRQILRNCVDPKIGEYVLSLIEK